MDRERPTLWIDADDGTVVHVTWGRSGKRAIVTVTDPRFRDPRQALLTAEQSAELGRFLSAGPDPPGDR